MTSTAQAQTANTFKSLTTFSGKKRMMLSSFQLFNNNNISLTDFFIIDIRCNLFITYVIWYTQSDFTSYQNKDQNLDNLASVLPLYCRTQNNIYNRDSAVIVMRRNPCYVTVILIYRRCYNVVTSQSPLTATQQYTRDILCSLLCTDCH